MFFILSKLLNLFTHPVNWIMILLISGYLLKNRRWQKRILWTALVLTLVCTNRQLSNLALDAWAGKWNKPLPENQVFDLALVPGGTIDYTPEWDQPNVNESFDRILEAIRLYRKGQVKKMYLLGESAFNHYNGVNAAIVVITSGTHMRRLMKGFRGSGLNLTPRVVDVAGVQPIRTWIELLPSWDAARDWQKLFHEVAGMLVI